jgi:hypothetical protein
LIRNSTFMAGLARSHANAIERRSTSAGLVFALTTLIVLIVGASAFLALVLWPKWPAATAGPDVPSLPLTVGGVLFNVPPGAIRVPVQRHAGAQERVDLAFLWPSLEPPDPEAKPAPTEGIPPIDRLFVTIEPQSVALPPAERVRTIYPRYLGDTQFEGPDGLKVVPFRDGTPYHGEDLFFDPASQSGFVARCSRPGAAGTPGMCLYERRIDSADVTLRFPSEWLAGWRKVNEGIGTLIGRLKPAS